MYRTDNILKLGYLKLELLVIAGQLNCGEYVLKSCTHRPSSQGSWGYPKSAHRVAEGKLGDRD